MVAEAPLHLDGRIAWADGVRWHFEEETHRLLAKELPGGEMLAVVTDPLGTPKEMFDARGRLVWAADHHVWGAVRAVEVRGALAMKPAHARAPDALACPWRFPGQYEDAETGLYYNRHRHYDPLTGHYTSPDPIGLAGGDRPQAYVQNPTVWTDPLGLSRLAPGGGLQAHENAGGHLLQRHVGKTDAELASGLQADPKISGSSTFTDRATAERSAAEAVDANPIVIKNFLQGSNNQITIKHSYGSPVGRTMLRGQSASTPSSNALFIIRRDPTMSTGYRIHTGYPTR
ncbi:RNase A-like domain-containing protein [Consotaella aegiceratis]|uniref:RNase A-like domain-containing protein n=1 Tax=Consotaella aegiceratis TaxID=3097961 RepID=UPI002F404647